jgi:hypothetical protein
MERILTGDMCVAGRREFVDCWCKVCDTWQSFDGGICVIGYSLHNEEKFWQLVHW